jgi:hypothetical protein
MILRKWRMEKSRTDVLHNLYSSPDIYVNMGRTYSMHDIQEIHAKF